MIGCQPAPGIVRPQRREVFQSAYNYAIMIAAESCIAGALHWFGRALLDASEFDRDNMVATFLSHEIGAVRAPVAHAAWDRVARPDRNRHKSCWTLKVFLRMTRSGQYTEPEGRFCRGCCCCSCWSFAVQSFAVQTHIHGQPALAHVTHVTAPAGAGAAGSLRSRQLPALPGNAACRHLCRAGGGGLLRHSERGRVCARLHPSAACRNRAAA